MDKFESYNFAGLITSMENGIFVISVVSPSFWKVFIKFRLNGQKLTTCFIEVDFEVSHKNWIPTALICVAACTSVIERERPSSFVALITMWHASEDEGHFPKKLRLEFINYIQKVLGFYKISAPLRVSAASRNQN